MASNGFLVSLLCAVLLIGGAAILCGWIESRFALLARWANRTGRAIEFPLEAPRQGIQWSLRSTLLVTGHVAVMLAAVWHESISRELAVMVGVLDWCFGLCGTEAFRYASFESPKCSC